MNARTITLSASALMILAGTCSAQVTWQRKSRVEQTQAIWNITGSGVELGQIELSTALRTHEAFAAAGGGDRVGFRSLTGAGNVGDNHATNVAGIMAGNSATYKGAAPDARLQWADWTATNPANAATISNDFLNKMRFFLAAPRAPIVNMSAGIRPGAATDNAATTALLNTLRGEHQRLADWSVDQGLLFVAAAGNDGRNGASTVLSPASGFNVLTVGGTGNFGNASEAARNWDQIGTYSSRGPVNQPWSGGVNRTKPDLVAPGFNTNTATGTANNAYTSAIQGTSFAAPQVAGTAAMLHQFAAGDAVAKDPRVMRSILMNSTNKTVRNSAGTRWDELNLGRGTQNMSDELGTGRLDALAATRQLAAGRSQPTFGNGSTGADAKLVGWDRGVLTGVGEASSNDYLTEKPLRKGTYLTATLSWNRHMNVANGGAAPTDFTYDNLNDLDLGVAKLGSINTMLSRANSFNTANEHLVYKVGKEDADRTKYYLRAWQFSHSSTTTPNETYGLSWRSVEAPAADGHTKQYNGNFNPGLGAPADDGWYVLTGTPRVGERPWSVADPVFGFEDNAYAMQLKPGDLMAQECSVPMDFLDINLTYGFTNMGGSLQILLNGINILEFDGIAGDDLLANSGPLNSARNYSARIDLTANPEIWAGMWNRDFTEVSFSGGGAGFGYVDDLFYVPTSGTAFLTAVGFGLIARRRRD